MSPCPGGDVPGPGVLAPAAGPVWPDLEETVRRVAVQILRRGKASRAELARELEMSTGSLTRVTRPLLDHGLVQEEPASLRRGTGRPSVPLAINPARAAFVGVNITGSTVYAVLTDLRGDVQDSRRLPIEDRAPAAVVELVAGAVAHWDRCGPGLLAVGVALGAGVVDGRWITRAAYLGWGEVDLGGELAQRLHLPVVVENDVHALTQAAQLFGPGRGAAHLAVVTVGIGVGAGVIANDQLLVGRPGQAGAIGHLPLEGGTLPCPDLGHSGCAVAELGTAAVERKAAERLGRPVPLADLLTLAETDDAAGAVVRDTARMIGALGGMLVAVLAPEVLMISGDGVGLALAAPAQVREGLARVAPDHPLPELVLDHEFSFDTWARGAAGTAILHALTGRLRAVGEARGEARTRVRPLGVPG